MTTANHILTLKVSGTSANGAPAFSLYVNGTQTAANVAVTADFPSGQWQTFTYSYSSDQPSDSIQIVYNNDYTNTATGADRNLYVDTVTLDGSSFQAALAKGATAATVNNAGTAAALYTNGSLSFASTDFKASTSTGPLSYLGVNYASAQYPSQTLAAWNQLNTYPTHDSIDYFASKGLNILRLPILWERVQPVKNGPLDTAQLSQIKGVIDYAASKGITVIVDPHNFGSAFGGVIGESSTTNADFANFWGKLAGALKGSSNVMFGLMNEPHVQTATDWLGSVNAAVAAIRAAGATSQKILVPGSGWDGGGSWMTNGNATAFANGVVDPSHNYAFEVHQYLDADTSGKHNSIVSTNVGVERLQAITQWAETNNQKLFLGEIGVGSDATSLAGLNNTLAFMKAHSDAWLGATYWEAGSPSPFFSIDPVNGIDKPQMAVLQKYAPGTASSAAGAVASSYTVNGVTYYSDGSTETKAYAKNGTLIRDTKVHTNGTSDITTYAITGESYTTDHTTYAADGTVTAITRTHADGSLDWTYVYNTATRAKTTNQYTATGRLAMITIVSADGSTETKTYAANGSTLLRDTQVHARGGTDVYQYAITGQSYTAEHDVTNAVGVTTAVTRTHANGSLAYTYTDDTKTGIETTSRYTAAGRLASRTIVGADGSTDDRLYASNGTSVLKDTQVHAGGSRDIYLYGITGASYTAEHDTYNAAGVETSIVRTHGNGALAYTHTADPATGKQVTALYSAAGILTTRTTVTARGSSVDTQIYGSDGKTLTRESINASGGLQLFYGYDATAGTSLQLGTSLTETSNLAFTGGSIELAGHTLTVTGRATFAANRGGAPVMDGAGALQATGAVTLNALTIGGSAALRVSGTLTQNGTLTLGDGSNRGAQATIAAGGLWQMTGNVVIAAGSGTAALNITGGTLAKVGGTGTSIIAPQIVNATATQGHIKAAVGTLELQGSLNGPIALEVSRNSTLILEKSASAGTAATFAGGGTIQLNNAPAFSGSIAGFAAGATIDLRSIADNGKAPTLSFAAGILSVSDGTHTAHLKMVGSYSSHDFALASDKHGGTAVTYI